MPQNRSNNEMKRKLVQTGKNMTEKGKKRTRRIRRKNKKVEGKRKGIEWKHKHSRSVYDAYTGEEDKRI